MNTNMKNNLRRRQNGRMHFAFVEQPRTISTFIIVATEGETVLL